MTMLCCSATKLKRQILPHTQRAGYIGRMTTRHATRKGVSRLNTRTEDGGPGSAEVPRGSCDGTHFQRASDIFGASSATSDRGLAVMQAPVYLNKVAAIANDEVRTIPSSISRAILVARDEILVTGVCMYSFPIDLFQGGADTSVTIKTDAVIASLALESLSIERGREAVTHPNDHSNKIRSSNDGHPTGFRLALDASARSLWPVIDSLTDTFNTKGEEFSDFLTTSRYRRQDAVPMTLVQEFTAFALLLREEVRHLQRLAALLLEVNVVATAIGTGPNASDNPAELVVAKHADVSELPVGLAHNLIEPPSGASARVSMQTAVMTVPVTFGQIYNESLLLKAGRRAGSIVPAVAANPVLSELVNEGCFTVVGNDMAVSMAAVRSARTVKDVVLELGLVEHVLINHVLSQESLMHTKYQGQIFLAEDPDTFLRAEQKQNLREASL